MSRLNKIVTSQVDSSTGTQHDTNTYSYDGDGILVRHDDDRVGKSVVGPGVLYGANKDSSEQTGLNTIKLIPNEDLGTDQFLVIEPTNPNHIHIRAGGAQDESNALLILGGEKNAVVVDDETRAVGISTRYAQVQNNYLNTNPESTDTFWTDSTANIDTGYTVTVDGTDYLVSQITAVDEGVIGVKATGALFTTATPYTFRFDPPYTHQWTFNNDGHFYGPAMGGIRVTGLEGIAGNELYLGSSEGIILATPTGAGPAGVFLENSSIPGNQVATLSDIRVDVPASSIGQSGDVFGKAADDINYHYFCTATYDGTTHIWKRIAWSIEEWGV